MIIISYSSRYFFKIAYLPSITSNILSAGYRVVSSFNKSFAHLSDVLATYLKLRN